MCCLKKRREANGYGPTDQERRGGRCGRGGGQCRGRLPAFFRSLFGRGNNNSQLNVSAILDFFESFFPLQFDVLINARYLGTLTDNSCSHT